MTRIEFEHKILKMRPKMLRVATDFFHNEEDAEDIVQEVYERMLRRGWHEGDNLEALLIRATKNLCVSVWRRQRLRETEALEGIEEPSERHTADSPLLQGEQRAALENAIQQLPPSEQRLVRMKGNDLSLELNTDAPRFTVPLNWWVIMRTHNTKIFSLDEWKEHI